MIRDVLQRRLKDMEEMNPSEHDHCETFLKSVRDRLHFTRRAISRSVTEYTSWQALRDDLLRMRPALEYAHLCRMAALMYRSAYYPYN